MAIFDRPSLDPLPEDPGFEDVKHAAAKGVLSLLPILGEVLNLALAPPPLEQQRNDWLRDLESRLRELEEQVKRFRIDDPGQREFISSTIKGMQAALRAAQEKEKLEALRDAVRNVAGEMSLAEDKRAIFSQLAHKFSPLHLRLLKFADDPKEFGGTWVNHQRGSTSVYEVIYMVFPDLCSQFQLVSAVVVDLRTAGLITAAIAHAMSPAPPYSKWATFLGEEFLRFVENPDDSAVTKDTGI